MSIDHSAPKLDGATPYAATAPADALRRVAAERDAVLRGLVHALSNRIGTVSAIAGMLDPEAPAAGVAATVLQGEGERLERLLEEFRLLAAESTGEAEPLHLPDLVAGVVALHAHHPTLRDAPCDVVGLDALPPALGDASEAARALLAALGAAKRAGGEAGARVRGAAAGEIVLLVVEPAGEVGGLAGDVEESDGVSWPLPHGAGTARLTARGGEVVLPTLAAARR